MKRVLVKIPILCFRPVLLVGFLQMCSLWLSSQTSTINIIWANEFNYRIEGNDTLQNLVGGVELNQDTVYLYCDSAVIKNSRTVVAKGNFILQHGTALSIFSDSAVYNGTAKLADLKGNVSLIKNKQKLFTDSLSYNTTTKIATYRNGANLYDDTTRIRSKRGYFHAKTDDVFLSENVSVSNSEFSLKSDTLKFNATSKIVTFLAPTIILLDSARVYTEQGYYDINNKRADFYSSPQYVKKTKKAWANFIRYNGKLKEILLMGNAYVEDTASLAFASIIRYNEKTEVTTLSGSAFIRDKNRTITGDTVVYDALKETYSTRGRTHIVDGAQILEADQVDYDTDREIGSAKGRVIWQDTLERIIIQCHFVEHSDKTKYLKAVGGFDTTTVIQDSLQVVVPKGRPLLIKLMESDSLFVSADTLLSLRPSDLVKRDTSTKTRTPAPGSLLIDTSAVAKDTIVALESFAESTAKEKKEEERIILAYREVRIFKNDMQAVCDSLSYSRADSMFRLYKKPFIWADQSQFRSDTVIMLLANNRIDQALLRNESFIVTSPNNSVYNQIKGRNSIASFTDGKVSSVRVEGNSQSVYYVLDDDNKYIGVNKTECSDMKLVFTNNDVTRIVFYDQPKSSLTPMKSADLEALKLPGFSWDAALRPKSVEDISRVKKELKTATPPSAPPAITSKTETEK